MRKLSLDLNQLAVESFETDADGQSPRGTVRGNAETDCCTFSCQGTCGIIPDSTANLARPTRLCGGDTEDLTGCMPCCA
jgi:hypothetical protein